MMYVNFCEYKLRLNTRGIVALEKKLGCNPVNIFTNAANEAKLPTVGEMVAILHAALQPLEHGVTEEKAFGIFDDWLAEGHTVMDFIKIIIELYKVSGIIPNEKEVEVDESKNA